jgi:DNA-binding NtrC family response regulator
LDSVLSSVNAAFDHIWKTRDHHWVEVVRPAIEPLIGVSRPLQELRTQIEAAARHERPLLIMGEPGSGKEFVARLIHQRQFQPRPFIRISCAALSADELEQAFAGDESLRNLLRCPGDTDGDDDIEAGTLYLDGLERLSAVALHAFISLLETYEQRRWRGEVPIKMRVVAAALPSAFQESGGGTLPMALQQVVGPTKILATTPLRDRVEDIALLVEYFLRRTARKYGSIPKELHPEALQVLMRYDWPGNVKELSIWLRSYASITGMQRVQRRRCR